MKKIFYTTSLALLLVFSGCKNAQVLKCPDISVAKQHHTMWVKAPQPRPHNTAVAKNDATKVTTEKPKDNAVATANNDISGYQIKIPRIATGKLNEDDLDGINKMFEKYSGNQVHVQRNDNGKLYLKAHATSDIFKLAKTLAGLKRTGPAAVPPGDLGRVALAGGIIGIVAIILALGPFVSYGAFLLGLIAIILGAVGLFSSRRGWAIVGIVLGVLAIVLAGALGIGLYVVVLHI